MCHTSCNNTIALNTAVQSAAIGTISPMPLNHRRQSKLTFRPFRKVAKSARINLNKYWGLLSQSSLSTSVMKRIPNPTNGSTTSSSETLDYTEEMEQNRFNEMLEAQAAAAISENALNSEYENSPDFQQFRRVSHFQCQPHHDLHHHHHHHRQNSVESFTSSWATSSSISSSHDAQSIADSISHDSFIL